MVADEVPDEEKNEIEETVADKALEEETETVADEVPNADKETVALTSAEKFNLTVKPKSTNKHMTELYP